ncbi:MAG: sugar phosphorylase [Kiritimatiellia bacterium]
MLKYTTMPVWRRIRERLEFLYADRAERCLERMGMLIGRYGVGFNDQPPLKYRDQADSILITYGDMISDGETSPLETLEKFLSDELRGAVTTVHLLPFFPYSSDDGFSVLDYRTVDPALGKWKHIDRFNKNFSLMFDLVLNHVSRGSEWFRQYARGIAPERRYFIEMDPSMDLSQTIRPRSSPLLSETWTRNGLRHLWTTFSEDQMDLDFSNPDVLFEFLDILLLYISHGARIIRLDAIAYLWKKPGTSCIHLPETHVIVKLFRDFIELLGVDVALLTETNVPQEENTSYFGNGDEAHLVYQFPLPPLLLQALVAGDSGHLTRWAAGLQPPPAGCRFVNFTASHDGIGVRPLEGLIRPPEMQALLDHVRAAGGQIAFKRNADGSESPYELNITYFDALDTPDRPNENLQVERFLCSQAVMLALKGIPAVYFNSLIGGRNWAEGVQQTGRARTINRQKWTRHKLAEKLGKPDDAPARIFRRYRALLLLRAKHPAFHPDGAQETADLGQKVFTIVRTAPDKSETVTSISNFTDKTLVLNPAAVIPALANSAEWHDLISGKNRRSPAGLELKPYETCWIRTV